MTLPIGWMIGLSSNTGEDWIKLKGDMLQRVQYMQFSGARVVLLGSRRSVLGLQDEKLK